MYKCNIAGILWSLVNNQNGFTRHCRTVKSTLGKDTKPPHTTPSLTLGKAHPTQFSWVHILRHILFCSSAFTTPVKGAQSHHQLTHALFEFIGTSIIKCSCKITVYHMHFNYGFQSTAIFKSMFDFVFLLMYICFIRSMNGSESLIALIYFGVVNNYKV